MSAAFEAALKLLYLALRNITRAMDDADQGLARGT